MNKKTQACFTPHVMIHSLFGFGLGLTLATLIPGLDMVWLGLLFMAIAFVLDYIRKS